MDLLQLGGGLITGGGLTWLGNAILQWRKERSTTEVRINKQRDGLTFDLLKAARDEMGELRQEVTDLRSLTAKAAHIEEALDHIHALLHAEGDAEMRAAARRATAFLKRMRPDPVEEKGNRRNAVQREISAAHIINDAKGEDA